MRIRVLSGFAPVAQLVEHSAFNRLVLRSSRSGRKVSEKEAELFCLLSFLKKFCLYVVCRGVAKRITCHSQKQLLQFRI